MDTELLKLAEALAHDLRQAGLALVTAESCTGGGVAQVLTAVPGSSLWFERGFVTYSNVSKHEMLGVSSGILARHGAVSEQTARAMAEGALKHSHADLAVAITGIAGPTGGTPDKPIGTVCLAWARHGQETRSQTRYFSGDRDAVRRQAVRAVLQGVLEWLQAIGNEK